MLKRTLLCAPFALILALPITRIPDFMRWYFTKSAQCSAQDVWNSIRAIQTDASEVKRINSVMRVLRSDQRFVQIRVPSGDYWLPKRDLHGTSFVFVEETKSIYEFGNHRIRPGDTVLDGGANVGVFARRALQAGASKVVCIDPSPEAVECLRRNFANEIESKRVVVYAKGLWNKEDHLEFTMSEQFSLADTVALRGPGLRHSGLKVPLTTIDKAIMELGLTRVDFIKLDIEGAEREALEGAVQSIARFQPKIAVALEHHLRDLEDVPDLIARQWPAARITLGPCSCVASAQVIRVQPEVAFAAF